MGAPAVACMVPSHNTYLVACFSQIYMKTKPWWYSVERVVVPLGDDSVDDNEDWHHVDGPPPPPVGGFCTPPHPDVTADSEWSLVEMD